MRIFGHTIGNVYFYSILLLVFFVAIASYSSNMFPLPLIFGVIWAIILEFLIIKFYLKKKFRVPYSAIITSLIIGAVAPLTAPILLIITAVTIAILSKFIIKFKSSNILNPAVIGLLISLAVFSIGDEWWIGTPINIGGVLITITPILIILPYISKRLTAALSFILTTLILTYLTSPSVFVITTIGGIIALFLSVNYFFVFVMLSEPRTSPSGRTNQIVFGAGTSLLYILLSVLGINYSILISLLIANILYFIYRYYHLT